MGVCIVCVWVCVRVCVRVCMVCMRVCVRVIQCWKTLDIHKVLTHRSPSHDGGEGNCDLHFHTSKSLYRKNIHVSLITSAPHQLQSVH